MSRPLGLASALLAAAALGALAATGLAGGDGGGGGRLELAPERYLGPLAVRRAEAPAGTGGRELRRAGSQSLEFFQTVEPLEVEAQTEEAATLECPRGFRALGGYYLTGRPGTVLDLTAPQIALPPSEADLPTKPSKRKWLIGVFNTTQEPDQVHLGVTCLNRLR